MKDITVTGRRKLVQKIWRSDIFKWESTYRLNGRLFFMYTTNKKGVIKTETKFERIPVKEEFVD